MAYISVYIDDPEITITPPKAYDSGVDGRTRIALGEFHATMPNAAAKALARAIDARFSGEVNETRKLPCPTPHPDLNMPGLDAFACQCGASWRKNEAPEGATTHDALNIGPSGRDE